MGKSLSGMCLQRACSVKNDHMSFGQDVTRHYGRWLSPDIVTISFLVPFTSSQSAVALWSNRFRPELITGCLSHVSSLDGFASRIPPRLLVAQSRLPCLAM